MAYTVAAIFATSIIFPVIVYAQVAARFWMRLRFQRTYLGLDDWLILLATVIVTGMAVGYMLGATIGVMGRDGNPVPDSHMLPQKKLDFAQLVFEKPAYGAIKTSVLLFYRRIFIGHRFRIINNWLLALITAWWLTFFLADLFLCGVHPDANWDATEKAKGYCLSTWVVSFVFSITDVITDAAIIWLPYPEIARLHLTTRKKWEVASVFMLGGLDFLIGLVRFGIIIATQTVPAFISNSNPPEAEAPGFWTFIEVAVGIIAANMPALAPLANDRERLATVLSTLRRKKSTPESENTYTYID